MPLENQAPGHNFSRALRRISGVVRRVVQSSPVAIGSEEAEVLLMFRARVIEERGSDKSGYSPKEVPVWFHRVRLGRIAVTTKYQLGRELEGGRSGGQR